MDEKISVIMAVYNAEKTLSEAVDSILNQTYGNFEFIICDDASADGSFNLLQEYAKRDSRIILIHNEKNSKLSFSLNHCLKYTTGKYVARMDADDISVPERFEKQLFFLENHPTIDLVGTAMERFNEEGVIDVVSKPTTLDKYYMKQGIPFNHATIMTYKRVYDRLEGYTVSERTKRAQDFDLWFRFFAAGFQGANLDEALYLVREDAAAIRRRTFKVRWNAIKTRYIGYQMLDFPIRWMIIPSLIEIMKGLVPYALVDCYRKYQKKKFTLKKDK